MTWHPWKRLLTKNLHSPRNSRPQRPLFRVEQLEDRAVPATFALQYSTDGGTNFTTIYDNQGNDQDTRAGWIATPVFAGISITAGSQAATSQAQTKLLLGLTGTQTNESYKIVARASINGIITEPAPQFLAYSFSGLTPTGGTVTRQSWVDDADNLFGTSPITTGPKTVGTSSTLTLSAQVPYSLTTEIRANFTGTRGRILSLSSDHTLTPSAFTPGSISGTKFQDLNGNGARDNGEGGLEGWAIQLLDTSGHVLQTTTTATDGSYSFTGLLAGIYRVREVGQDGWQQITVNPDDLTVVSGSNFPGVNFGNFQKVQVSGTKFTDLTGNGIGAGDTPLGGVTIKLYQDTNNDKILTADDGDAIATATTDTTTGAFSFPRQGPGTYFVQEVLATEYVQTDGPAYYTVTIGGTGIASGGTSTGNNFANFKKITISGTKKTDLTGNSFSDDDKPLAGVTIYLYKDGGSVPVATAITNTNGAYTFADLGPGTYFVQELLPAGYTQTGGADGYTIVATSGTDSTGNNFANFRPGSISGVKTLDRTGDGFSTDDTALAGVTIYLDTNNNGTLDTGETSTTTGANGAFSFTGLAAGTYTVREVLTAGYTRTGGPASYTVVIDPTLTAPPVSTGNNFANFRPGSISGFKYTDVNGDDATNGIGADDTVLGNVAINLFKDANGNGTVEGAELANPFASTFTLADGSFTFSDLAAGTYFVQEAIPANSVQTYGLAGYTVVVDPTGGAAQPPIYTGSNFANFQKGRITGTKFSDANGDGSTAGDSGLGGVTISLYLRTSSGDAFVTSTTTATGTGAYAFENLAPGTYLVKEVVPANAMQTVGADGYEVVIGPGGVASGGTASGNDFANFELGSISGMKFEDANGNGTKDTGETGLSGWTIYLDTNNNGNLDSGEPSAVTGTNGAFAFIGLAAGTYTIREVGQSGWTQTAAPGAVVVTSGTNSNNNNLGNRRDKPGIDIEKTTSGSATADPTTLNYDNEDTPNGPGVLALTPGSSVTWYYKVTNTGNVPFTAAQVVVTDDAGTPDNTADDFRPTRRLNSDVGNDGILSPGEVWYYAATGTVQSLTGPAGTPLTFNMSGNTPLSGTAGNIRTYSSTDNTVMVNASAFSRLKAAPNTWAAAYLGSYGGGLGVTDAGEGTGANNTHTVDNAGDRDNYILLEFSQNVVVDLVTLGYVVGDSDLKAWIGTVSGAFNSHKTLSDAFLNGLGFSELNAGAGSARTADLNAGKVVGNILVIAAKPGESDDMFKLASVIAQTIQTGVYANKGTVTVPGATDCDLSHYTNPTTPLTGSISGHKYLDVSGNGLNLTSDPNSLVDPVDTPLEGVTIYLDTNNNGVKDGSEPFAVTDADGKYTFTGLAAGTYYVREIVTDEYVQTGPLGSGAYTVTLATGQQVTGKDFANAEKTCDDCTVNNVSYKIVHADGTSEIVTDLRGQTMEGDLITATFFVNAAEGSHRVSFVSYTAPDKVFDANTASQQKIYDLATGVFNNGGPYSLTIHVPNSYYQVDLVCGYAIDTFGPGSSNIFYTPQMRLVSADNNGTHAPVANAGSISGVKYNDLNGNGKRDANEPGLKGWVIYIDSNNNNVRDPNEYATVTADDGSYTISNLAAGTYTGKVKEVAQAGWTQKEAPGTVCVVANGNTSGVNFGNKVAASGSISGYRFNDRNADGEWDKNGLDNCWGTADDELAEVGLGVFVDYDGDGVKDGDEPSATTDANGYYNITGVKAGTWTVVEVMQSGYVRTTDTRVVTLTSGEAETNVNFGNFKGSVVTVGDTATVNFWKGTNGQKLIKSLNGGGTSGSATALGNWLASNFSKMYGAGCGSSSLAGKTNAQIAAYFYSLACDASKQLQAQVLATVLAVYATDSDWAGGTYATSFGFTVNGTGVKNDYYNVGDSGAAFGVTNDSALTVWDILQRTNARASNGVLWSGYSSTVQGLAKAVFVGINAEGRVGG